MDEIAQRNFLAADAQLKLAGFGRSLLLPMSTDMDPVCDNDFDDENRDTPSWLGLSSRYAV